MTSGVVATRQGDESLAMMDRTSVPSNEEPFPWRTPDGMLYPAEPEWSRSADLPFPYRPG